MSTTTLNLTQLNVIAPARALVPGVREWESTGAAWEDERCMFLAGGGACSLKSPWFELLGGREYHFELAMALGRALPVEFSLRDPQDRWVARMFIDDTHRREHVLSVRDHAPGRYRLVISSVPLPPGEGLSLGEPRVVVTSTDLAAPAVSRVGAAEPNTCLPHWGVIRRAIHRACKRSRFVNTLVSAAEMRLEREELLSLPQYMSLCPTGQCNASCDFCSVTTNRTGIIKRELPFDRLHHFLSPVRNTIRMYGIEGNGEPTLYDHFDELIDVLSSGGATFYLITNAERLTPEQVDRVVQRGVSAVNVSLNAATAETHREVMHLKHFDRVIANVRRLASIKSKENTTVSVSFVVTGQNIHEVVDFIRLADRSLKVDHIYVRPLSEIANDRGVVEDQRGLVPYESEVRDMIERVRDHLKLDPPRAMLHFAPEMFRAVRSDPVSRTLKPLGFKDRLLAPRPSGWETVRADAKVLWGLDDVTLNVPPGPTGEVLRSVAIPVDASAREYFQCRVVVRSGLLRVALVSADGTEHESRDVMASVLELPREVRLGVPAGVEDVRVVLGCGSTGVEATVDFERLRVPGRATSALFRLPEPRRWEVASEGATAQWNGPKVRVRWQGAAGPYLLKSFSQPCRPNEPIHLPVDVVVHQGTLGIGVLSADFSRWTHQFKFPMGQHTQTLRINPAENERVQIVIYSSVPGGLDAEIDWGERIVLTEPAAMGTAPAKESTPTPATASGEQAASSTGRRSSLRRFCTGLPDALAAAAGGMLAAVVSPFTRKRPTRENRYYCQKPWTDLNNFTVDGRMDVCCIATGRSQTRYALGNIFEQSFQDIWNGPVAREFRRTVNHPHQALPPCARCPMAYQYQGPLFDPVYTPQWVHGHLAVSSQRPWLRRSIMAAGLFAYRLIHPLLFRGFKGR